MQPDPQTDVGAMVADLRAELDAAEALAHAATGTRWRVDDEDYPEEILAEDHTAVVAGGRWGGEARVFETNADALHIGRHDPARVLRLVAAHRAILDLWEQGRQEHDGEGRVWDSESEAARARTSALTEVVRLLASAYASKDEPHQEGS